MEINDGSGVAVSTTTTTTNSNNNTTTINCEAFLKASRSNQHRISACCHRLAMHVRTAPKNDGVEFFNLCLSLARGIGYAIANKEVPREAPLELPLLLKQVCQLRNDSFLHAAVLVLMISVKNACENKWFSDQDSKVLCNFASKILSSFCSTMNFTTEPNNFLSNISTIMSRYYPKMKMGKILAFLEVKPGYGTYVRDFLISKDTKPSPGERIRLFVAQLDSTETSSCLITPTQANFLLNGRGVERRNNVFMDTGPQMPTNVYHLLAYGMNLLQAVGQFNGNYIVAVAFMSMVSTSDHSTLQDYIQPTLSMVDPDSEIIEGPSRISLNCPISFKRINVPVKGHMCKHHQCFDYENYIEINSRRPSWRCPHCNQHVCFTDIRIDQNIAKVLKEVEETVNDVIISSDGSWKAIMESDDHSDKPQDKIATSGADETAEPESSGVSNGPADILDLTVDDYEVDTFNICEKEDRIVSSTNCQSQSDVQNMTANSHMNNINELNQNSATQIQDNFWSGIFVSTFGDGASSSRSNPQIGGVSEPNLSNLVSPVLTDSTTPALNQGSGPFHGDALLTTSVPQGLYGQFASIPRHVSRTPVAVQSFSDLNPTSTLHQRPANNLNTLMQNGASITSQTSAISLMGNGLCSVASNMEKHQLFSRTHSSSLQGSSMNSSTLQQYPGAQTVGFHAPSQTHSYKVSSVFPTEHQASGQPPTLNIRAGLNQSPRLMRPSTSFSRMQTYQGGSQTVVGHSTRGVDSQQAQAMLSAPEMAIPAKRSRLATPYAMNMDGLGTSMGGRTESTAGVGQPMTRTGGSMDLAAEQDWRPTGRMRGSLSGRAYSDAFKQFIIQPTQQGQSTRPTSNVASRTLSASSQLEILMANRTALAEAGRYSYRGSASTSGGSGVLPSGMNGLQGNS